MSVDVTITQVGLPPAFIGEAYEASVAYKSSSPSVFTAQSISVGALPEGLSLDAVGSAPGSLRISGTPTGAANATPQSGVGTYSFTVSCTDTNGTVTKALSIRLYASRRDPDFADDASVAGQVKALDLA